MMLAYVGAEAVAPALSVLAAICGVLLIGWRWIITRCKRIYRFVFRIKVDDVVEFEKDESADAAKSEPLQKTGS